MNTCWDVLALQGFLKEQGIPERPELKVSTFSRTFPATAELPRITVGLGLIDHPASLYEDKVVLRGIPDSSPEEEESEPMTAKMFLKAVKETSDAFSHLPDWQAHVICNLGYAAHPSKKIVGIPDYYLFSSIPEEERSYLIGKYGLHKIATVVAFGFACDAEAAIEYIETYRASLNYFEVFKLLASGVPGEEFDLATQLPDEWVAELYQEHRLQEQSREED